MMKNGIIFASGVWLVLSLSVAHAQAPEAQPKTPQPGEKADTGETLQKGIGERPWAAGVAPDEQKTSMANLEFDDPLPSSL